MINNKRYVTVFETDDYDKFKKLKGNRDVKDSREKAIEESVKEVGFIEGSYVIVNEKMEVIDGQGRLEVCKKLNIPVPYVVVSGIGDSECLALNRQNTSWNDDDRLNYWCEHGHEDCIRLKATCERLGEKASFIYTLSKKHLSADAKYSKAIKGGTIEFDDNDLAYVEDVLGVYSQVASAASYLSGSARTLKFTIGWLVDHDVDRQRFVKSFNKNYATMQAIPSNTKDLLWLISNIYNKGYPENNKRHFDRELVE